MAPKTKALIKCVLLPLFVGLVSWLFSRRGYPMYKILNQPPLSPPAIIFPIVWTVLYLLMGIASWLVLRSRTDRNSKTEALFLYFFQLTVNFFWSIIFFRFQALFLAFIWLLFLWALVWMTIDYFHKARPIAAYILVPYLLWITFAGYLNLGIVLLNRS